jgi:putative transposase
MSLGKPSRLSHIFQKYDPPLYLITFCTEDRRKILANPLAHAALHKYGQRGLARGIGLGRYVIMPDHIHLFVREGSEVALGTWIRGLKRVVAAAIAGGRIQEHSGTALRTIWQRGFFDHVIRSRESYSQKWKYVRENPVRAGLVTQSEAWPFQGEICLIEHG